MAKNRSLALLSFLVVVLALGAIGVIVYNRNQSNLIPSKADGTSNSKLGIFINDNAQKVLDRGPRVIKIIVPNPNAMFREEGAYTGIVDIAKKFKTKFPSSTVLLRFYFDEMGQTRFEPATVPADDAAETVFRDYEPILKKLKDRGDLRYFDYIAGPPNETERVPYWSQGGQIGWMSRFWETLTDLNSKAGIKTCVGNILTGDIPVTDADVQAVKTVLIPKMNSTGSIFCYHGYSDSGFDKNAASQEEHVLRYRIFYRKLGANAPKMIIGELGIADGYKSAGSLAGFTDWLEWYDSEIKKDSQIIGATIYTDELDGPVTTWLANYLSANGGGTGTTTPPPGGGNTQACFDNCFKNIKPGNGSYCRDYCKDGSPTQTPTPTGGTTGPVQVIEDTSPLIKYTGTWGTVLPQPNYKNPRGGSFKQCGKIQSPDCTAEISGIKFDRIIVGAPSRPNGSSANVLVDGTSVGTMSQTGTLQGDHTKYNVWTKDVPCGTHDLKFVPNWQTGAGNLAWAIDYIELRTCTSDTTPPPTQGGTACQGNVNAPAKCFSCRKDTPSDQLNILDFSCFSGKFGKAVQ